MHTLPLSVPEVTVTEHENKTYYLHKNAHATIKCTRSHSYRARKQDLLLSQECTRYHQMYQKSQLQSTKTRLTTFTRMHTLLSNVPEVTITHVEYENKTFYLHKNAHPTIKCTRSHNYTCRVRKQDSLPSQECTRYYQMYQKSQLCQYRNKTYRFCKDSKCWTPTC